MPRFPLQKLGSSVVVLSAISVIVNLAVHFRGEPVDFTSEAARISLALQRGQGFANPFAAGPTGPTAHAGPIYPFLHAAICRIFGTGPAGSFVIIALTALAWSIQLALAQRFAAMHGKPAAGAAAALVGALLPLPGILFKWGAIFTGLALAALAYIVSRILSGRISAVTGLRAGLLAAAAALSDPVSITVCTAWTVFLLYKRGLRQCGGMFAVALAVFAALTGAWTVRNYVTFGTFMLIRGNFWHNMEDSFNECVSPSMSASIASGCYAAYDPDANAAVARTIAAVGEVRFNAAAKTGTLNWVRAHPARTLQLILARTVLFWFPIDRSTVARLLNGVVVSAVTVLGLFGITWCASDGFQIAVLGLLTYSPVYYLAIFEQRYRYPIFWISILLAGVGVETLIRRMLRCRQRDKRLGAAFPNPG